MIKYKIISVIEGIKRESFVDANSKEDAVRKLDKHLESYGLFRERLISVTKSRRYNKPKKESIENLLKL